MAGNQIVSSLVKATEVLQCVCQGISKISDIARKLQYDKTTVYRILNTYEQQGFVTKDPGSRRYFPGHFLQSLSINPSKVHKGLIYSAMDEVDRLNREIDEPVALQVPYGTMRYLLYAAHFDKNSLYYSNIGGSGPLYTGADGKVLLSQMDDVDLRSMLEKIKMLQLTDTTTTDPEAIWADIHLIREQGYMITYGEYIGGVAAIAVPIGKYICPVSLSTAGPQERITEKADFIVEKLKKSRVEIESRISFVEGSSQ